MNQENEDYIVLKKHSKNNLISKLKFPIFILIKFFIVFAILEVLMIEDVII